MKRLILVLLLPLMIGSQATARKIPAPLTHEERVDLVDDSLKLTAWLMRDTTTRNEPLIVLLHQLGLTHESYQYFIDALAKYVGEDTLERSMPTIVSFDLRGHGKSIFRKRDTLDVTSMSNSEFAKMPGDVKHMLTFLKQDPDLGVDTTNIIVIGASIGANTAAMLTEQMSGVRKIVLLSPGKSYHGLEPGRAVENYKGKMLIFCSQEDIYSKKSSEFLDSLNKSRNTLEWFGGGDHGTEIINGNPKAMHDLIDWVMK
jgi:pimeloyl-ACP methyl ester carboxylesterase